MGFRPTMEIKVTPSSPSRKRGPRPVASRFRGNDVTLEERRISHCSEIAWAQGTLECPSLDGLDAALGLRGRDGAAQDSVPTAVRRRQLRCRTPRRFAHSHCFEVP